MQIIRCINVSLTKQRNFHIKLFFISKIQRSSAIYDTNIFQCDCQKDKCLFQMPGDQFSKV